MLIVASSAAASSEGNKGASSVSSDASSSTNNSSFLDEPIAARAPLAPSPELINEDLAPVLANARTFTTYDIAALWIGLVVRDALWGRRGV